ncbi:hypothetical protein Ancab_000278 [Ancistrocladus abbreviatus]
MMTIPNHLLSLLISLLLCLSSFPHSLSFQSDELLVEEEEFGLEGGQPARDDVVNPYPTTRSTIPPPTTTTIRRRSSDSDSDSKVQFILEHAFGESEFTPAGSFSARLKTWSHGGQTLTKLRFSRNSLPDNEKAKLKELLREDDFYKIRLPSNVLSPSGNYSVSSVRARCLPREGLDEHFVIHMEGVNILAVNYGSPGACPYPRQLKIPAKWSFNSHTILKYSELAPRTPVFTEEILGGENVEGEGVKPPEKSFWAKYWMYLIPLGLIIMNAVTQAMNMPEEQAAGQSGSQQSAAAIARGPNTAVRRR